MARARDIRQVTDTALTVSHPVEPQHLTLAFKPATKAGGEGIYAGRVRHAFNGFAKGSEDTATTDDTAANKNLDGPYSQACLHDLPSDIQDADGTLIISGIDGAPSEMPAGASVDGTGGLTIVACVPPRNINVIILSAQPSFGVNA